MTQRPKILAGAVVAVVALVVGLGTYLATRQLSQVPRTVEAIEAIQAEQAEREAVLCDTRHRIYVALLSTLDLSDRLSRQPDLDDPRIPAQQGNLARENRAEVEQVIAEARAVLAPSDCITATP